MADIFISYRSNDRTRVEHIVQALQQRGLSVWWDPKLRGGQRFARVIATELAQARAVVVAWSHLSVESEWVADEAQEAKDLGKLVPILIDDVRPPLGFRSLQNLSLVDWDGQASHPSIQALFDAIDLHLGAHSIAATDEACIKPEREPRECPPANNHERKPVSPSQELAAVPVLANMTASTGFKREATTHNITAPDTNGKQGMVRPSIAALACSKSVRRKKYQQSENMPPDLNTTGYR